MWCTLNIKQPRAHAALIHAWADGAEIQYSPDESKEHYWEDIENPSFLSECVYRIKPKVYRYRMALMCEYYINNEYFAVAMNNSDATDLECHSCFVKWFTDWKEVQKS